ncbi:MAG: preprotein translocase subunit SecG, partial [Actinobacteria bacterium]|nr:preprotein translocase subunit SecG [Actinomycetota bacterium]
MTALYYLLIFLFLFVSIILCFAILIQESKSTGLGASFGGDFSPPTFSNQFAAKGMHL